MCPFFMFYVFSRKWKTGFERHLSDRTSRFQKLIKSVYFRREKNLGWQQGSHIWYLECMMVIFLARLENMKVKMNFRVRSREKVPFGHKKWEPDDYQGTYMAEGPMQIQCGDPGRTRIKDQDSCAITAYVNWIMVDAITWGNKCPILSGTTHHLPETMRSGIGERAKREREKKEV